MDEARNCILSMVLPGARRPASVNHTGNRRLGLMHLNCLSRWRIRYLSSQSRNRGPSVNGRGVGSRMVRCRIPALVCPILGSIGVSETRVRRHSFSMKGRDAAGSSAGRENA